MPTPQDFGAVPIGPNPAQFGATPIPEEEPNLAAGNAALARTIGNAMKPALDTVIDMGSVYAPVEAGLNAATGLLFGFPASMLAALNGLTGKYILGRDVNPKELMDSAYTMFTYIPTTERGKRLTGNVMLPLEKLAEGAEAAGHKVTDVTGSAGAGAVTDAAIQMLPAPFIAAFGRRMSGQIPAAEDFHNTAKVMAGDGASAETVGAIRSNLRETFDQTGLDPFTVEEAAKADPGIARDLAEGRGVPEALKPAEPVREPSTEPVAPAEAAPSPEAAPAPDLAPAPAAEPGAPLLDVSGATADELRRMAAEAGWAERGGRLIRSGEGASADEIRAGWAGAVGPVVGRTAWVPRAEWFQAMRQDLPGSNNLTTQREIQAAVDKALAGEKLTAREKRTVDWMTEEAKRSFEPPEQPPAWSRMSEEEKNAELDAIFGADTNPAARARPADVANAPGGEGGAAKEVGFSLEGQTEAEIAAARATEARDAEAARIKAGAPPPEDFTLSGSTRPADEEAARGQQELVDLNMGVSPAAYAKEYTPFVGVEMPKPTSKAGRFIDALRKVIAPAARGTIAEEQAGIMRANFGELAREREVALEKLKGFAADFDKRKVKESYDFIDAMETGKKLDDPKLQAAADAIRTLLDDKRAEVQALGKGQLDNFIENYFPHIWKDEAAAQSFYSRRPLTGSGAFLKERTFDSFKEGLDAGLKPISTNPVELALLKAREMDRYVYGQKIFEEMKTAGLAKFVRFGDQAPTGWTKINDKIARVFQYSEADKGMIVRGEYYSPDEAATLINNHLSPGLQGNAVFDIWRGVGMAMNAVQLGLSLFHVGFTTLDSMVSRVALGVKQVVRGDVLEGAGNMAVGVTPAQPFLNIYKGDKLLRAYLGNLSDPDLSPIVEAIMQAGGRVKMDDFYRNATVNAFKQAIRTGDALGTATKFLPTILDRMSAPIFEQLVPRQKLGVYFDMAKDWTARNPDATLAEKRAELGKLWDSVDNRMGQLVYDNVFWNRALKDGLMATVRSVGWNLGTFRELGGGIADINADILKGKISDRTAYVIALPLLAALYGAVTQYAYTGEGPRDMKDLFFPRTGRTRPDGSEDRVSLPTYMKDVFAYGQDVMNFAKFGSNPTQTLQNKAHPMISTISQMLNNEDFFGATIRNPSAPAVQQIMDEANYLMKQVEPFSLRNYQQQAKLRGVEPSVGDYLTSPSMVGITPAPGYIAKSDEEKMSEQVSKLRDPLVKKFRQQIKDGATAEDLIPVMLKAGLTRQDIRFVIRSSGDVPKPHRMKSFGEE